MVSRFLIVCFRYLITISELMNILGYDLNKEAKQYIWNGNPRPNLWKLEDHGPLDYDYTPWIPMMIPVNKLRHAWLVSGFEMCTNDARIGVLMTVCKSYFVFTHKSQ
jgi:hypothetical protein